jgi:glycosyltransferase involved in cell wall biosynthesis
MGIARAMADPNLDSVSAPATTPAEFPLIAASYVIFCRIPLFIDPEGMVHAPSLWALDLERHFEYILDFRICCPVIRSASLPADMQPLPALPSDRVIALGEDRGWGRVFANLLPNFLKVYRAARLARIVHSDIGGWPFPLSYYLLLLRPFSSFQWLINMESSFWMKQVGVSAALSVRIRHHIHLFLSRACMRCADVRMFTQDWYREMLLGEDRRNCFINEAVWVQEQDLLSEPAFEARAATRSGPVRLLFPTRLVPEKGIASVLAAIRDAETQLAGAGETTRLIVDIIGSGPMEAAVRDFIAGHPGRAITVSFLDPVAYGAPFFELLGGYDAILVANLMEEQPRILFDAFSQGIPSIASRTSGIVQVVGADGDTTRLFTPGAVPELAARLVEAALDRTALTAMGRRALTFAQGRTHRAMHLDRARYLAETLDVR